MTLSEEFPQDSDLCYLNHAAVAPWPKRARDAVVDFADENLASGARHYPRWLQTEQRLRKNLATLVNAPAPEDIALVKNTSEALSMVAYGMDWNDGDEVVITDQEFPSNRIVWESLASFGVRTVVAPLATEEPEAAVEKAVTAKTRLVAVSSIQYGTGLKLDIARLGRFCRSRNVLFCVDAIQSIGCQPLDVQAMKIDFTMADGHKWLLGAEGLALFYVRPALREKLRLHEFGWHMVEARGEFDQQTWEPAGDASRFECGSPNMLATQVLLASTNLLLEQGMPNVADAVEKRIDHLHERLSTLPAYRRITPLDPARRGGILTFHLAGVDSAAIQKQLMDAKVICAYRGGGIRFSPHFYTPFEVLDTAVERLEALLEKTSAER